VFRFRIPLQTEEVRAEDSVPADVPDTDILKEIRNAAERGDVERVFAILHNLDADRYGEFRRQVLALAQDFALREIIVYIDRL